MNKVSIVVLSMFLSIASKALSQNSALNGSHPKSDLHNKKVIPYPYLRKADILWSKLLWETIDLKQKINFILYYSEEENVDRHSLYQIIKYAALNEGLILYKEDDQYKYPVTKYQDKLSYFVKVNQIAKINPFGEEILKDDGTVQTQNDSDWVEGYEIVEYHIKEKLFFENSRAIMDIRIIGITGNMGLFRKRRYSR